MDNSESILVSVLLPAYNAEKYIAEAIQSVLSQTYVNFELIIVDDGSTDSTGKIIDSFSDKRIKHIVNEKNIGLIATLNKGLTLVKGELVMRMDADDICLPLRMERQVAFLKDKPEIGICGCNYIEFSKSAERFVTLSSDHNEIYAKMLFNSSVVHPSLMIRMSLLKDLDVVFDNKFPHAEDYELWSRLIFNCKFSNVNELLFRYRLHEGQVTKKHKTIQTDSADKVRRNLLKQSGFVFSEEELRVHCLLGSSQRIRSSDELRLLESWLRNLIKQNEALKIISPDVFVRVIGKQWYDACGISTLGLRAFFTYLKSDLKRFNSNSRLKLLAKCIVRKWVG
ncbi:MAG: glycosyltransferase [Bacteroidota bacterium]|nr:glycosyltransferase [Bacteroidota bacterium]